MQGTATPRSVARVVIVVALAIFVLGSTLPNLVSDSVGLPFSTDDHNRVVAVFADNSPARVGDIVDWQACDVVQKLAVSGQYFFEPGTSMSIPLIRSGRHFLATFRAQPQPSVFWLIVIKRGSATAFVII